MRILKLIPCTFRKIGQLIKIELKAGVWCKHGSWLRTDCELERLCFREVRLKVTWMLADVCVIRMEDYFWSLYVYLFRVLVVGCFHRNKISKKTLQLLQLKFEMVVAWCLKQFVTRYKFFQNIVIAKRDG